jgi:hypothetical protein
MKTSIINELKDYSLTNLDNYNKTLKYDINDIIEKYINLINEYLKFILEKSKLKNNNYSKFIITRGYDTITNVFNIILYNTKNLDLTFYHCQKAYYYYTEFIEQIYSIDHVFLQLNSKDASTYVYKKTIFELDNEIKQKMYSISDNSKNILDIVDEHIKLFKNIFEFILQLLVLDNTLLTNNTETMDKFKVLCQKIFLKNYKTMDKIKKIYYELEYLNDDFLTTLNTENITNKEIIDNYFAYITQKWK